MWLFINLICLIYVSYWQMWGINIYHIKNKTKKLKIFIRYILNIIALFEIIVVNPLHVNISKIFLWKHDFLKQNQFMKSVALFYIFSNPNIWLNRKAARFHTCFWIQTIALCCFDWSIWRKFSLIQLWSPVAFEELPSMFFRW